MPITHSVTRLDFVQGGRGHKEIKILLLSLFRFPSGFPEPSSEALEGFKLGTFGTSVQSSPDTEA